MNFVEEDLVEARKAPTSRQENTLLLSRSARQSLNMVKAQDESFEWED
jgi:hypothetical protein